MPTNKKNLNYDDLLKLINIDNINELTQEKLLDINIKVDEVTGINIYFHLLGLLVESEKTGEFKKIAHLSNLISFYIFDVITPPFSEEIAMLYAKKSLSYEQKAEYKEWIEYIKKVTKL